MRSPGSAWLTSAASMAGVPEPAKTWTVTAAEPTSGRIPAWTAWSVAALAAPVWLRTGSARALSTGSGTGVGPGIMRRGWMPPTVRRVRRTPKPGG
jgi:hypothetical protein